MRGARKRGAENDGERVAKREKVQDADDDEVGDVVGDEDDDIEEADDAELDNVVGEKELAKIEEAAGISAADTSKLDWQGRIDLIKKARGSAQQLGKPRAIRRASVGGKWSAEEDASLRAIVEQHGAKNWKRVSALLGPTRTDVQCLHRWNKVLRPGLHKGAWSEAEDDIVREMVSQNVGAVKWSTIAARLPGRIGKQCRERWFNHLDPTIKRGDWDPDEDRILYEAQRNFGNRWCEISKILPGRTENAVKNRWNSSTMRKWLKTNDLVPGNGQPIVDLSLQGGLEQAINSFKTALESAGVKGADNLAELIAPGPADEDEYSGRGSSSRKGAGSKKSRGGGAGAAAGASASGTRSSSRPTHSRSGRRYGDDSAMADMLGSLKSSPTGLSYSSSRGRKRGRGRGRRGYDDDDDDDDEEDEIDDEEEDENHNDDDDQYGDRADKEIDDDSLTSQALRRLFTSLQFAQEDLEGQNAGDAEVIPLAFLSHFSKFNAQGQSILMRQLIEKFERTNTTPRNALLPTPGVRFDAFSLPDPLPLDAGMESPRFSAFSTDAQDWESVGLDEGGMLPFLWGMGQADTPSGVGPLSTRSTRSLSVRSSTAAAAAATTTTAASTAVAAAAGAIVTIGEGGTPPADIAILVAYHMAARTKCAGQIMRMLVGDGALDNQRPASMTNASMGPPVGTLSRRNSVNKESSTNPAFPSPRATAAKPNPPSSSASSSSSSSSSAAAADSKSEADDNKPSVMSKLPAHLRPPLIVTDRKRAESSTERLVEMLENLKSETPSPLVQAISGLGAAQLAVFSPKSKMQSGALAAVAAAAAMTAAAGGGGAGAPTAEAAGSTRQTRSRGRGGRGNKKDAKLDAATSALKKLYAILQHRKVDLSDGDAEVLPLTLLPYFAKLNRKAQRNLMRQLIEKFQRTNTTPRNAILPTPAYGAGHGARFEIDTSSLDADALGLLPIGGLGLPDTPRSLAVMLGAGDNSDWDSNLAIEVSHGQFLWGGEPTPKGAARSGKASARASHPAGLPSAAAQMAHLHQQGSGNSLHAFSESGGDDGAAPIDMAVLVAFHVSTHSRNAENIMLMLLADNGGAGPLTFSNRHPLSTRSAGSLLAAGGPLTITTD